MLSYDTLKDRPRDFLAATGVTPAEFRAVARVPGRVRQRIRLMTQEGKPRQRRAGGGAKGTLPSFADKLLFILVYQKTNPLQVMHGLQFALSQSQTNYWIHRLLPVLQHALRDDGTRPGARCATCRDKRLGLGRCPDLAVDGTERRRQRPTRRPAKQQDHYSGKKKTHTDKNILLVNAHTSKVVYLGPTLPGKTHDKKAVDEAPVAYRTNTTLDKDTGFQGYEPGGVLTTQPKKSPKAKA